MIEFKASSSTAPEETLKEESAHLEAQENWRKTLAAAGAQVAGVQTEAEATAAFYGVHP